MVQVTKKMGISPVTTAGPVVTELRTANSLRWISIDKVKAGGGTDAGRGLHAERCVQPGGEWQEGVWSQCRNLFISDLHKKKILFLKAGGFVLYWQKLKLGFVQTQHEDRAPVRPWVRPGCSAGLVLVSGKERSGLCGREGRSFCGQVATELLLLLIPCHPGHLEL